MVGLYWALAMQPRMVETLRTLFAPRRVNNLGNVLISQDAHHYYLTCSDCESRCVSKPCLYLEFVVLIDQKMKILSLPDQPRHQREDHKQQQQQRPPLEDLILQWKLLQQLRQQQRPIDLAHLVEGMTSHQETVDGRKRQVSELSVEKKVGLQ